MARNKEEIKPDDKDLVKEVAELQRVVKALLKFVKNYEEESGEEHMPEGEYYGQKFE